MYNDVIFFQERGSKVEITGFGKPNRKATSMDEKVIFMTF